MSAKIGSIISLTHILAISAGVGAELSELLTDSRRIDLYVESDEGREWARTPSFPFTPPLYDTFDITYVIYSDAGGGPGSSSATAWADQLSSLTPTLFIGSHAVNASASASASTVQWGYHAIATAQSRFGATFRLLGTAGYELIGAGNGRTMTSLKEVGGTNVFSEEQFSAVSKSGQLAAGVYEFQFAVMSDAIAPFSPHQKWEYEAAAGNFTFRLGPPPVLIDLVADGVRLHFTGTPNTTYTIERAPSSAGPWEAIASRISSASGFVEFTERPQGMTFYRTWAP